MRAAPPCTTRLWTESCQSLHSRSRCAPRARPPNATTVGSSSLSCGLRRLGKWFGVCVRTSALASCVITTRRAAPNARAGPGALGPHSRPRVVRRLLRAATALLSALRLPAMNTGCTPLRRRAYRSCCGGSQAGSVAMGIASLIVTCIAARYEVVRRLSHSPSLVAATTEGREDDHSLAWTRLSDRRTPASASQRRQMASALRTSAHHAGGLLRVPRSKKAPLSSPMRRARRMASAPSSQLRPTFCARATRSARSREGGYSARDQTCVASDGQASGRRRTGEATTPG